MMKVGAHALYKNLGGVRSWGSQPHRGCAPLKNVAFGYDVGKNQRMLSSSFIHSFIHSLYNHTTNMYEQYQIAVE